MRLPILVAGLCVLALGACSTPESRVRSSLIKIGLPAGAATCMADNVASRLTSRQIRALSRMSGVSERGIGRMTIGEFTRLVARSENAEMAAMFARAGVGCAVMS